MEAAIEFEALRVAFPDRRAPGGFVTALEGLTLTVPRGAVFGFLGPNGAGKTTTLQSLLGFVRPTSGTARIFGRDIREAIARQRVGYLPDPPAAYSFLTAREWLETTARWFGLSRQIARERAMALLHDFGLADAANRRIGAFSRGMRQRLGLAESLVNDPDLLIWDEPASGMDPLGRLDLRRRLAELGARGKTVFFSSHELSEVELSCNRIAILARGRLVLSGCPADFLRPGERLEQLFLRAVQTEEKAP